MFLFFGKYHCFCFTFSFRFMFVSHGNGTSISGSLLTKFFLGKELGSENSGCKPTWEYPPLIHLEQNLWEASLFIYCSLFKHGCCTSRVLAL